MKKIFTILILSSLFAGELEVDGDLNVTGTIQSQTIDLKPMSQYLKLQSQNSRIYPVTSQEILIMKTFMCELHESLDSIYDALGTNQYETVLDREWELVQSESIDYSILEKTNNEIANKIKLEVPLALFPEHKSTMSSPALVTALSSRLEKAISIDNGVMHMIGLANIPMIVLFGPTNPEKFAPEYKSSVVLDSKKLYNTKNISSITVEDVLMAAKQ